MVNEEILQKLNVMIYADGADHKSILSLSNNPIIKGFTTNPSLMKKNGITNYKKFALEVSKAVKDKPISFEVFACCLFFCAKLNLGNPSTSATNK